MLRARRILHLLSAGFFAGPLLALRPAVEPAARPTVSVAVNVFADELRGQETLPLAMALANGSKEPLYVCKPTEPYFRVWDADGKQVKGGRIRTPPPPPPSYWMERDGRRVLMEPVVRLEPGGGVVTVIPDALAIYHGRLPPGRYTLKPSLQTVRVHQAKDVVRRENLPHKEWVVAASDAVEVPVQPNTVSITIQAESPG